MNKYISILPIAAGLGISSIMTAYGEVSSVKPTKVLQRVMVPDSNYEVGMGVAEFPPNAAKGRHTHPGVEVGYVLRGEITQIIEGRAPKIIKAGESFQYPAYIAHDTKAGPNGAKVLATWVAEKGKPIVVNNKKVDD